MNQKIEEILEFHKIRHAVREFANTQKAKTMILQLPIETNTKKIRHKIEETRDAVTLLRLKQGIPIPKLEDISVSIKRLEVEAGLNGRELSEILKVLQTTNQVANFFEKVKEEDLFPEAPEDTYSLQIHGIFYSNLRHFSFDEAKNKVLEYVRSMKIFFYSDSYYKVALESVKKLTPENNILQLKGPKGYHPLIKIVKDKRKQNPFRKPKHS